MTLDIMLIGTYIAVTGPSGYLVGGLFAIMMLSQRVATGDIILYGPYGSGMVLVAETPHEHLYRDSIFANLLDGIAPETDDIIVLIKSFDESY
jgi:hypothetical protein